MNSTCKKLVTDITRDKELDINIPKYVDLLKNQYNLYSTVKLCLNYYTMKEMVEEGTSKDCTKGFNTVTKLLKSAVVDKNSVSEDDIQTINNLRDKVEYRMKILTSFTDGYEIYEYILNRLEAGLKDECEEVDVEQLSAKMFKYVFSENDTVVVNSKLQLLMSQLPVRMTKNKFYDVVANTLSIYKGGETSSVEEFVQMLRTAVLIDRPEGFDTEYPELYEVFSMLEVADYKNITIAEYDKLIEGVNRGAAFITNEVSVYMLFQEIINDTYSILLTMSQDFGKYEEAYKAAVNIISKCISSKDMETLAEELMDSFMALEGVQENVYENVMILEAAFDDTVHKVDSIVDKESYSKDIKALTTAGKLLSTSLFIDLTRDFNIEESVAADGSFIDKLKVSITDAFAELFKDKDRKVVRSIMCKILSAMPIFLNTQQEIKNYFDYVLGNCNDSSELTAVNNLISEIIEED